MAGLAAPDGITQTVIQGRGSGRGISLCSFISADRCSALLGHRSLQTLEYSEGLRARFLVALGMTSMGGTSCCALAKEGRARACFPVFMFSQRTDWRLTPNRLSQAIEEHRRRGLPLLDLTESNPTRCGFTYDAEEILAALADARALAYEPDARGLLLTRQAITAYYAERGVTVGPEQIFLTTSTSEAYSHVFRLLANPGDNILAPAPSYPLFDFLARLNDVELNSYPLLYDDAWQMDMHALEAKITAATRAILVVHPNNPTGSFVRRGELESLLGVCRTHSLALIADEVFADYVLSPVEPEPPAGAHPRDPENHQRVASHAAVNECLTFTLSGLSKISALPQMKLAWIVVNGPSDLLKNALARLELIADTYLSVSAPLAHALPVLLETRHNLVPQVLNRVRENLRWLDRQLAPGSVIRRLKVAGGWYVVLKLPATRTDEGWALELLAKDGVLVHPGHFYDFPSDGYLVLSLLPTPEIFKAGIGRVLSRANMEIPFG